MGKSSASILLTVGIGLFIIGGFFYLNNITGNIILVDYSTTAYAPPYNLSNPSQMIFNITPEQLGGNAAEIVNIGVNVSMPKGYVYKKGYIFNYNSGRWEVFNFDQTAVGSSYWIKDFASANLIINSSSILRGGENYIVAYACEKVNNSWECGCNNQTSTKCANWMLQIFNVTNISNPAVPGCTSNDNCSVVDVCDLDMEICVPNVTIAEPPILIPQFSEYWDNNFTLLNTGRGIFNVTVANTNGTVVLEINGENRTATNLFNNVYGVLYDFSAGGIYTYRWHSWGSGASKDFGVSADRDYKINISSWFYQENANSYLDGTNPVDLDPSSFLKYVYINYTKPIGTTNNSFWLVKYGLSSALLTNLSVAPCWNANPVILMFRMGSNIFYQPVGGGPIYTTSSAECFNGTGWIKLGPDSTQIVGGANSHWPWKPYGGIQSMKDGDWSTYVDVWYYDGTSGLKFISSNPPSGHGLIYEEAMWWNINS